MVASAYLVVAEYWDRRIAARAYDVSQTVEHEPAGGGVVG
jgi:hypothetical protein